MKRTLFALATTSLISWSCAQTLTPEAALERFFTAPEVDPAWFSQSFLDQVPAAQLEPLIGQLIADLGAFRSVEGEAGEYTVLFERGALPAYIVLNAEGQITGLQFLPPIPTAADLAEALEGFRELPGEVSVLVLAGDEERAAIEADAPLAVGSSFKLAVLAALKERTEAGERAWDEVVRLEPAWKSLPSGLLQDWPDGSALTLETLATLMISQSDNTATDALIHLLGRETVEASAGDAGRNRPLLTTRELFVLKNPADADLLARYREGDEAARRAVLAEAAARALPDPLSFPTEPTALDVEWFYSTRELCALIAQVAELPPMRVNPGVVDPDDWTRVAFKGGSEPGVMNLTTYLEAEGTRYCVSVTQNREDAVLEEARLLSLYSGLLAVLGDEVAQDEAPQ
jgi:beta-lactamase class A